MLANWRKQHLLHEEWSSIVVRLAAIPIKDSLSESDIQWIVDTIAKSVGRYALGYRLRKRTFKLLIIVKRILADKRHFEILKALDYLISCHNISTYKISKEVKKQAIAYCCTWAVAFLQISKSHLTSNPFHTGHVLRRKNNGEEC